MNAMSVSPVKPAINPGNHTVPAVATNLTKPPLPSSNNFTPINSIPETKPVPAANVAPSNSENSVDVSAKPPTSNGTVSPIPETNSKENAISDTPQNHTDKSAIAENLSTTDNPPKPVEVVPEVKNLDKTKPEESKNAASTKDNSEPAKVTTPIPQVDSSTEPPKEDAKLVPEDKKEVVINDVKESSKSESQPSDTGAVETKPESVPQPSKETPLESKSVPEDIQQLKESAPEESKVENVKTEEENAQPQSETTPPPAKTTKRKVKQPVEQVEDDSEGRKSKRVRLPTQPYQSPIPELQFIAKLQTPAKTTPKPATEKIIAFYKNEFLAVRNPEGSFYICQTFQNIHRSSSKIKIRWFTNLPNDIFTPDFGDVTEFDCILTNVQMTRVEKDRWKLPEVERTRIENILKRALDVEKGVADKPSITEEHPDGLDLSLFKDEAQLKKKKKKKKKSVSPKAKKDTPATSAAKKPSLRTTKSAKATTPAAATSSTKKSARLSSLSQTSAKETTATEKSKPIEAKTKKDKKKKKGKQVAAKASTGAKQNDKTKVWEPSVKSSNSSKVILSLKKETNSSAGSKSSAETTTTKTTAKRTSSVSSRASAASTSPVVPQKRRKEDAKPAAASQPINERTGKVRNAGSAVTAKINSAAMRTTKDKERKVSNTSSQRKK